MEDPEQAVEAMIAEGRRILAAAIEQYRPAAILAAYSGGDDSVVSTHHAVAEFGAAVVHCDTGVGLELTRRHVRESCDRMGWPLEVGAAEPSGKPGPLDPAALPAGAWADGGTAYEEFVLNFGFPGPAQHSRCYRILKERPLAAIARRLAGRGQKVLVVAGIRHDESLIRAGYRAAVRAQPKSKFVWANPFYWRTAADFAAYRDEFGLPRNPAKARVGISGECLCGAYASEGERELVRAAEPATASYLDDLESRVRSNGFPWGWGEAPPRWWLDARKGQGFLPFADGPAFRPMCVGCPRKAARRPAVT